MPISVVGTPTEAAAGNGGNLTLNLPSGMVQNDVVYVIQGFSDGEAISSAGWTDIGSGLGAYRKVMGASPDASIAFTGSGDVNRGFAAVAIALRGVNTTTPEDVAVAFASGTSTNPDSPSITPVTNGAWVISGVWSQVSDTAVTAPSGYSNQVDINIAETTVSVTAGLATKEIPVAGAENPAAWTNFSSGSWVALTIAVRPIPAVPSTQAYLM